LLAEAVGEQIAKHGAGLICGGGDGIMEAACRGTRKAGGTAIGVLKFSRPDEANPYIDFAIPTSMDLARNNIIIWAASGVIAFEGRYGTATEIALAMDVQKPIVVVGNHTILREEAFSPGWCRRMPEVEPSHAGRVVSTLIELIETYPVPRHPRDIPRGG